jgi:tripartite-type tricarboxylate transporter receptor subunit TctC
VEKKKHRRLGPNKERKMNRRIFLALSISFALLLCFITGDIALASPYYEGKIITVIVGNAPGGGYDRLARMIAKHLPKHIPGRPTVIVQNMPGASSMIAANYLYHIAKPDGLTIGALNRGLPFAQVLKADGVRFDLTKFAWIGSGAVEATVLALRADLPYVTIDDMRKAKSPIILGATGPTDTGGQFPLLLNAYLGLNLKLVNYVSSADIQLAIERKEVDGRAAAYSSLKLYIERGLMRPVIRGRVSEAGIDHLPVNEDLTTDKRAKTILAMFSGVELIGRPYVTSPRTPLKTVKILREAFGAVAKDPELQEDIRRQGMGVQYVPAEECLKVLNALMNQPNDIVKEFGKYIKF